MNSRQRRRQRRRVAADPELYALHWNLIVARGVLLAVVALVALTFASSVRSATIALDATALVGSLAAVLLARHNFRVRLAVRRREWLAGDPTMVLRESIADVFEVPDEIVEARSPVDATTAWFEHAITPHAGFIARQITDSMQRSGDLPMGTSLRWADPASRSGSLNEDVLDGHLFDEDPT